MTDVCNDYAPSSGPCPSNVQWTRNADSLNPLEAEWVRSRKAVILESFAQCLTRLELEAFDVTSYTNKINKLEYENVPSLGFARRWEHFEQSMTVSPLPLSNVLLE